jgi:hypothetical protein
LILAQWLYTLKLGALATGSLHEPFEEKCLRPQHHFAPTIAQSPAENFRSHPANFPGRCPLPAMVGLSAVAEG